MKWKNEYIISVICRGGQFLISMTIVIGEDLTAQDILNSINKQTCEHLTTRLGVKITTADYNYNFMTMVKQKLIGDEET